MLIGRKMFWCIKFLTQGRQRWRGRLRCFELWRMIEHFFTSWDLFHLEILPILYCFSSLFCNLSSKVPKILTSQRREDNTYNQTMFKTYMQYCEPDSVYCQKSSLKLNMSINCHKNCDARLWQIYRGWWLTQCIIWSGIFHSRCIIFWAHLFIIWEKNFWW